MAGLYTDHLTTDFLSDFRAFAQNYRYSLNKYTFALIDLDNEEMFEFLTTFNLGRFDSPGVFAIKDIKDKVFYRNYHTYYESHTNFHNISEQFVAEINQGQKLPMYAQWHQSYHNLWNLEYWVNNKMKAYIYIIGLISICILPLIVIVDCFFPLMGRGPYGKKKESKAKDD
jgi:hypothetical protein